MSGPEHGAGEQGDEKGRRRKAPPGLAGGTGRSAGGAT
ncbi:hypothetical protein F4557_004826 [Actinomadura catellatispora]|uniref:Uncharacterized protein n=1 Tax=Actinomadura livida TaxID=79909 RepID=A0A7W7MZ25_9ACTN|nr:hypothetical protein [Actinomadura catellatispora]